MVAGKYYIMQAYTIRVRLHASSALSPLPPLQAHPNLLRHVTDIIDIHVHAKFMIKYGDNLQPCLGMNIVLNPKLYKALR